MPARTSSVVAIGMIFLAVIGVVSIFGNAILAVVAPPGEAPASATAPQLAAPKVPGAKAPAAPAPTQPGGSAVPPKDGSS